MMENHTCHCFFAFICCWGSTESSKFFFFPVSIVSYASLYFMQLIYNVSGLSLCQCMYIYVCACVCSMYVCARVLTYVWGINVGVRPHTTIGYSCSRNIVLHQSEMSSIFWKKLWLFSACQICLVGI